METRDMRKLILALAVLTPVTANAQMCPLGTYPHYDQYGNELCTSMDGSTTSVMTRPGGMIMGGSPGFDRYGNQVTNLPNGTTVYGPNSMQGPGGCPMGSYPTIGPMGQHVCQFY
jgi:hypothetical protein